MWRVAVVSVFLIATSTATAQGPKFTPVRINVPPGYEVSLAAAPPLVHHPLMASFDDRGRLYVAENAGLNLPRKDLEAQLPNSVRRLEDTDGDGVFDKSTVFADKMVFPQGALWHAGSVYVASPPSIWKLTDIDDDGVADQREEIVNKFGYTGNAADIHGCFLGPEGRIYWCDGRHGHEISDADGKVVTQGKAARIFSCRLDGSDVQVHCGGGMDNPVEIDFTDSGDMLGTVNLMYLQRGDCLVHWLRRGVYPREDQQSCIDEFRSTGPLLGPVVDYGHVAVSGMMRYRTPAPDLRDNIFVTQFNSHKVVRTELVPDGSTFRAQTHDFLRGESDDFHPTDVLEDADGSLLVIDTGGWFRIGCPTSQIARPDILGAIYRIRRKDTPTVEDPRGLKLDWKSATPNILARRLGDKRFAVRAKVIAALAAQEDAALASLEEVLLQSSDADAKVSAVWALARMATTSERRIQILLAALSASEPTVRMAAIRTAGTAKVSVANDLLRRRLTCESLAERRAAATALGQIGSIDSVQPLLESLTHDTDRAGEHAVIASAQEIGEPQAMIAALAHDDARVRRAALLALDQHPTHPLTQRQVAMLLPNADDKLLTEIVRIAARQPEWSASFRTLVAELLATSELSDLQQQLLRSSVIAFGGQKDIQELVGNALRESQTPLVTRILLIESITSVPLTHLPAPWQDGVLSAIKSTKPELVDAGLAAAHKWPADSFRESLVAIARDEQRLITQRVAALAALSRPGDKLPAMDRALLIKQLKSSEEPLVRLAAARVIGQSRFDTSDAPELAATLAGAGALEVAAVAGSLEFAESKDAWLAAVEGLAKNPHGANVDANWIARLSRRYGAVAEQRAAELAARWSAVDDSLRKQIEAFEKDFADQGEPLRGQAVFFRNACASCHRINGRGGQIGPDLTRIGARRTTRDLVEAIVAPSASQARGFEALQLELADGRLLSGVVVSETSVGITLRLADQSTRTVARREVESISPSRLSLMPAGLEQTLTREQFADLVAYLRSLK